MQILEGIKRNLSPFSKNWLIKSRGLSKVAPLQLLEMRCARADVILYLRFSRLLCIWRAFKRTFTIDQDLSSSGCANTINWTLLKYIWNFEKEKSMKIEELKKLYPHVKFEVFHNYQEAKNFFNTLNWSIL